MERDQIVQKLQTTYNDLNDGKQYLMFATVVCNGHGTRECEAKLNLFSLQNTPPPPLVSIMLAASMFGRAVKKARVSECCVCATPKKFQELWCPEEKKMKFVGISTSLGTFSCLIVLFYFACKQMFFSQPLATCHVPSKPHTNLSQSDSDCLQRA